ncbi:Down syndrome cell adhesion molecule-like protein Dscam2 isoform X13 [Daphnia pulicaria]|uniref:Down syndrome cell adhesion molecule-like protein Dscam2 isoform X13 n=1 Tax=Daphnia pulicaria TaxID=35523 RepID=UPI001EEB2BE4|nr:Down syndrome cell adhesion molecule-like protein Dscam2 isoform X13 [Daphnia pulicaria]
MAANRSSASDRFLVFILTILAFYSGACVGDGSATAAASSSSLSGPVFLKEPSNRIDFSNTTGTVVECAATGNPRPEILWIKADGSPVTDVPGLRQVQTSGSLVFPPFRAEDYKQDVHAQFYRCVARNPAGSIVSRDIHVRAVVQSSYVVEVNNEHVILGNSAMLKCTIPSFVTDFVYVASWTISDERGELANLDTQSTDGKYMVLPSGELHIRDVSPEDGYKSYRCRTKHRLTGETRLSATAGRLVVTEPTSSAAPRFAVKVSMIVELRQSKPISLLCQAQGYPTPVFRWYKYVEGSTAKQPVKLDDRVKQVSGTLIIKEAKVEDSGKYLCNVNNSVGGESVETVLTVTAPLSASIEPQVQTVDYGRPATLTCNPEGNPIKSISWMKDGVAISHTDNVLRIEQVRREDKGMYQCFVRNDQESAQASAELKLGGRFDPPQFINTFAERTLQPGPSVSLKCSASGNPLPEITWELDGKKISSSERVQIGHFTAGTNEVVSYLNITAVHTNDGGLYKCAASSKVGHADHSARFNVYGLPFVRPMDKVAVVAGEIMMVTCPVAGYPIDTIQWEKGGRVLPVNRRQQVFPNGTLIIENVQRSLDQGSYTCIAKNTQGFSAKGNLEVQVMVAPQITPFSFGDDEALNAGDFVVVQCSAVKGDSPISLRWAFKSQPLATDSPITGLTINSLGDRISVLSIQSVAAAHNGEYTCTAENPAGIANYTAELTVNVPPRWIVEPTDKAFAQGSEAKIECKADGFPKPQISWKKAPGSTPNDYRDIRSNNYVRIEDGTLSIGNIQKSSEGYYLCEASNGIGAGLSAVIFVSVQAPPQFEIKFKNQTARRGEPAVLQCEAKGEKPIGILWNMNSKRLDSKSDPRYTIREEILTTGVLSDLSIKKLERTDSALFTCVATNAFGSDDTSINLIVQETPEVPFGVKVLDKSGRSVQLSWSAPYDGNSPLTRYLIEYKISKGDWQADIDRVLVPGQQTVAGVYNLVPATTYHFRLVAENDVGSSDPSETVTIITAEEAPGGTPRGVKVEIVDQNTLKVSWKPPPKEHWNGEILGYYVGYKLATSDKPYLFETVEFSRELGKEHQLNISHLKMYTQYSVVVQAFNRVGAGPMSDEVIQHTGEGTPEQAPQDVTCTALTSQSIRLSWTSPPLTTVNGIIKGYKVIYGPSHIWFDETSKDAKIITTGETILHGLRKYTNYSMQVLAFTAGGDGVKSVPVSCHTEQDVPGSPSAVKALLMTPDSILVSWKAPELPNGIVNQYTVYIQEGSEDARSQKVSPSQLNYEASGLKKKERYNFWVTASTNVGEGEASKTVTIAPGTRVPAKIASFDNTFSVSYREDVKLPCQAVGAPLPEIQWKIKGTPYAASERVRLLPEGSLLVREVTRDDAGEYTCTVENMYGQDTVTHQLQVQAPPYPPHLSLASTTTTSITIKVKPRKEEETPIHGYTVHYKPEFGDWETTQIGNSLQDYTIENLWCGTRYQLYVRAYNGIGTGEGSDVINTRTKGSAPAVPDANRFIEGSASSVTLHLSAWSDGGCPMLYFVVEYRGKGNQDWTLVSNSVKPGGNFVVLDLSPATWYNLRVTAHNNAGSTVAEYEFATLTLTGGTIAPARETSEKENPLLAMLMNLNLVVPAAAAIMVIIAAIVVICVIKGRNNGHKDDVIYNQASASNATMKRNGGDMRDELGYIPPPNRKLPPVPGTQYNTCDRIKRGHADCHAYRTLDPRRPVYDELSIHPPPRRNVAVPGEEVNQSGASLYAGMDDEICPYATFHLLGFREEMDPNKTGNQFQTFPHPNGGQPPQQDMNHHRQASQSMPRPGNRMMRMPNGATYAPENCYDDPANCDMYGGAESNSYASYTNTNPPLPPPDFGTSPNQNTMLARRSVNGQQLRGNGTMNLPLPPYPDPPQPPLPPPRTGNDSANVSSSSNNDSTISAEISEAECDREHLVNRNYGVGIRTMNSKDGMSMEEMRKLIEKSSNEGGAHVTNGLIAYDTVNV